MNHWFTIRTTTRGYIVPGRAIAEIDGEEYEIGAGNLMGFPTPSVAHHLRHAGSANLL